MHALTPRPRALASRPSQVLVTKEDAEAESRQDGLPTAPPASLTIGTKPDELPKNRRFYQIAHSIMETITTQPVMLKNGQLKEYQLKGACPVPLIAYVAPSVLRFRDSPLRAHAPPFPLVPPSFVRSPHPQACSGWCLSTTTT